MTFVLGEGPDALYLTDGEARAWNDAVHGTYLYFAAGRVRLPIEVDVWPSTIDRMAEFGEIWDPQRLSPIIP